MKVDVKNVEAMAKRRYDDNHDLRQYLKMQDKLSEKKLDRLVADITRRVWAAFDCTTCGNCCKKLGRSVTEEEARNLAASLGISLDDFRTRYLEGQVTPEDDDDGEDQEDQAPIRWRMKGKPCPFLKDNRCSVYEDRPGQCRKYPYLFEPDFSFRTLGMIERTFTCPIVYHVFEELKAELPYRQSGGWDW